MESNTTKFWNRLNEGQRRQLVSRLIELMERTTSPLNPELLYLAALALDVVGGESLPHLDVPNLLPTCFKVLDTTVPLWETNADLRDRKSVV